MNIIFSICNWGCISPSTLWSTAGAALSNHLINLPIKKPIWINLHVTAPAGHSKDHTDHPQHGVAHADNEPQHKIHPPLNFKHHHVYGPVYCPRGLQYTLFVVHNNLHLITLNVMSLRFPEDHCQLYCFTDADLEMIRPTPANKAVHHCLMVQYVLTLSENIRKRQDFELYTLPLMTGSVTGYKQKIMKGLEIRSTFQNVLSFCLWGQILWVQKV